MTHYEQRLEQDLERLRRSVGEVSRAVETALENSVQALFSLDFDLAALTIIQDNPINRAVRRIDRLCHAFVARHLPSAGHLRFISAVLRVNTSLERIGDYAVTICRETAQLSQQPGRSIQRDIDQFAQHALRLIRESSKAFLTMDETLARSTMDLASNLGPTYDKAFQDLLAEAESRPGSVHDLFAMDVVFNRLGRVCAQSKNICEEALFAVRGETKHPKSFRILFADETNQCGSQIAALIARKAFPEGGEYSCAGWEPGLEIPVDVLRFLSDHGHDVAELRPESLEKWQKRLSEFNVIVGLEKGLREHIAHPPFQTVLLNWKLETDPNSPVNMESLYKTIAAKVAELMETLRGEDAC